MAELLAFGSFFAGAFFATRIVYRWNLAFASLVSALESAYDLTGVTWLYRANREFRSKLRSNPEKILNEDDAPVVREAKLKLIECKSMAGTVMVRAVTTMIVAMGISVALVAVIAVIRESR